jgi:hypothetical protein
MAQPKKKPAKGNRAKSSTSSQRFIEPLSIGDQRKLSVQLLVWTFTLLSVAFVVVAYVKYA